MNETAIETRLAGNGAAAGRSDHWEPAGWVRVGFTLTLPESVGAPAQDDMLYGQHRLVTFT